MGKTRNNSLRMQQAVRSIFEDYRQKQGCLGHVYEEAACGCNNALQMWRGPKGEKGDRGPQGPKGDNAGSFLVDAEFVVDPEGQDPGAYLKLVLIDVAQQEQVVYVDLSELEDVYTAGGGIDIHSMVVAARLGAGLTFDNQGNITSAYQFCDGLDEMSNVVKVKLDANNNILGFAGSGCKGLTATVNLTQAASGVALVLTGASGTVLNTIPLNGGTGITIQKDAQGFTWLVDPSDLVSSTAGNNLSISNNKLYVGNSTLSYTVGDGVFTLTNVSGTTSTVTLPTVVKSLDRADMVCTGENAPYLHLTFKRDNGQNLYQDIDMSCVGGGIAGIETDVHCDTTPGESTPFAYYLFESAIITLALGDDGTIEDVLSHYQFTDTSVSQNFFTLTIPVSPDSTTTGFALALFARSHNDSNGDPKIFESPPRSATKCTSVAEYIAAGAAGLPLDYDVTWDGPDSGVAPFGPDEQLYMAVTYNGNDSYTFTFTVRTPDETTLTTDLVVTNSDGTEQRVDMKPLLTKIGGKVQEVLDPEKTTVVPIAGQDKAGMVFDDGTGFATLQDMCDWDNAIYPDDIIADDESVTCYYETLPSYVSLGDFFVDDTGVPVDATIYYYAGVDCDNMTDINSSVAAMLQAPVEFMCFDQYDGRVDCPQKIYVQCEQVEDEHGAGLKFTFLQAATKNILCLEPSCDPCIDLDFSSITQKTISSIQASFSCPSRVDMTGISFSTVRLIAAGHAHIANPIYTFVDSQLSITRTHTGSGYNYDFDRIYIILTKNGVDYISEVVPFGVPFYLYDPNDVPAFYMEPCVVSSEVLVYDIYDAVPYHLAIKGTNPDQKVLSSIDLDLSCLNGPGGFMAGRRSTSEVTFLPEVTVEDANRVPIGSAVFIASDCDVPPIIPPSEL